MAHVEPYPKLFEVFEEAGEWLDKLGIRNAGSLNDAIQEGRLQEISLVAEALHEARIAKIASEIVAAGDRIRVVLVAGPSSSGKTTFSKRLAVQLLANGRRPFPLALDDYFVDRELTPRDENGEVDFEALHALDMPLFNEHLLSLMSGHTTTLPRYSFVLGRREPGQTVTLSRDHVIIVEGIHGLNPALVPDLPHEAVYRMYVSALTQLNLIATTASALPIHAWCGASCGTPRRAATVPRTPSAAGPRCSAARSSTSSRIRKTATRSSTRRSSTSWRSCGRRRSRCCCRCA